MPSDSNFATLSRKVTKKRGQKNKFSGICFVFRSLIRTSDYRRKYFRSEIKTNFREFVLYFAHLFVPLHPLSRRSLAGESVACYAYE